MYLVFIIYVQLGKLNLVLTFFLNQWCSLLEQDLLFSTFLLHFILLYFSHHMVVVVVWWCGGGGVVYLTDYRTTPDCSSFLYSVQLWIVAIISHPNVKRR